MAATYTNRARRLGREHGRVAASWVEFSPMEAREWLRADREGDFLRDNHGPNGMPLDGSLGGWDSRSPWEYVPSSPLSGEWTDGMTPIRLMDEIGVFSLTDASNDYCSAYEEAYEKAAYREVARIARLFVRLAARL